MDSLVPTVRRALIDPLPEVRVAAAKTFDQLHNTIGSKALDDILPDLLKKMVSVALNFKVDYNVSKLKAAYVVAYEEHNFCQLYSTNDKNGFENGGD